MAGALPGASLTLVLVSAPHARSSISIPELRAELQDEARTAYAHRRRRVMVNVAAVYSRAGAR